MEAQPTKIPSAAEARDSLSVSRFIRQQEEDLRAIAPASPKLALAPLTRRRARRRRNG